MGIPKKKAVALADVKKTSDNYSYTCYSNAEKVAEKGYKEERIVSKLGDSYFSRFD
jgi:hypothetical protein